MHATRCEAEGHRTQRANMPMARKQQGSRVQWAYRGLHSCDATCELYYSLYSCKVVES